MESDLNFTSPYFFGVICTFYFGNPIYMYRFLSFSVTLIQVPTINQENGILGTEPTETLLTFRSDEVLRPSHKNKRQVINSCNLLYSWSPELCNY